MSKSYSVILKLFLFIGLLSSGVQAQVLSDQSYISLLTYEPLDPLYSAFGHSSIRVVDPELEIDKIYNYGMFNFSEKGFYAKFVAGKLLYYLGEEKYERFQRVNKHWERTVNAQVLNLDSLSKQRYFDFLENNRKKENRYYYYDFFYDNCATRLYDGLKEAVGDSLQYNFPHLTGDQTHRDLVREKLSYRPWDNFGTDLILGAVVDRKATPRETTFLPTYLKQAFEHAMITRNGKQISLVERGENLATGKDRTTHRIKWYLHPTFLLWLLFGLIFLLTVYQHRTGGNLVFDRIWFISGGLAGIILALAWFATDHSATAQNWNMLWLNPFHLIFAFVLKQKSKFVQNYFLATCIINLLTLVLWNVIPQSFNTLFIPLILIFTIRAWYVYSK